MGLSMEKASSTASSNATTNQSGTTANQYSDGQSGLQAMLGEFFQKLIPGMASGAMDPNVTALKDRAAGHINDTATASGEGLQRKLASRGMGRSGMSGKAALSTELARQGSLAGNEAAAGGLQLGQNNQNLLAALNYALTSMGTTSASTATQATDSKSKSSKFGAEVSGSVAF